MTDMCYYCGEIFSLNWAKWPLLWCVETRGEGQSPFKYWLIVALSHKNWFNTSFSVIFLICQFCHLLSLHSLYTYNNNFFIPFFIHIIKTPYWVFGFHDYKHHYRKDFYRLKSSSKWHYWKSELCSDYLYRDALWHYWIANTCLTQRQWLDIIANKVYCCQKLIRYD